MQNENLKTLNNYLLNYSLYNSEFDDLDNEIVNFNISEDESKMRKLKECLKELKLKFKSGSERDGGYKVYWLDVKRDELEKLIHS